jgi:hypothetical protein
MCATNSKILNWAISVIKLIEKQKKMIEDTTPIVIEEHGTRISLEIFTAPKMDSYHILFSTTLDTPAL